MASNTRSKAKAKARVSKEREKISESETTSLVSVDEELEKLSSVEDLDDVNSAMATRMALNEGLTVGDMDKSMIEGSFDDEESFRMKDEGCDVSAILNSVKLFDLSKFEAMHASVRKFELLLRKTSKKQSKKVKDVSLDELKEVFMEVKDSMSAAHSEALLLSCELLNKRGKLNAMMDENSRLNSCIRLKMQAVADKMSLEKRVEVGKEPMALMAGTMATSKKEQDEGGEGEKDVINKNASGCGVAERGKEKKSVAGKNGGGIKPTKESVEVHFNCTNGVNYDRAVYAINELIDSRGDKKSECQYDTAVVGVKGKAVGVLGFSDHKKAVAFVALMKSAINDGVKTTPVEGVDNVTDCSCCESVGAAAKIGDGEKNCDDAVKMKNKKDKKPCAREMGCCLQCIQLKPKFGRSVSLRLKNIPNVQHLSSVEVDKLFVEQYGELALVEVVKRQLFGGSTSGDIIVRVPMTTFGLMKQKDMLFKVGFITTRWLIDVFVPYCNRCKRFGHSIRHCQGEPRCIGNCDNCCEGLCSANKPACINCGGRHFPWDNRCPKWIELVAKGIQDADNSLIEFQSASKV